MISKAYLWAELSVRTFSDVLSVSMSCFFCVKMMLKTAWERLLVSFMLVAATVLKKKENVVNGYVGMYQSSGYSIINTESRSVTWLCFQSPSGPGCRCRRWRRVWTDPRHRVPSVGALWHVGFLCFWDSAGHAHAHSRSPCNSPGGAKKNNIWVIIHYYLLIYTRDNGRL